MRCRWLGVALVLAACAQPPPPGLTAVAAQTRTDEAAGGRLQVRVTSNGDAPVTVVAVALESPAFARLEPVPVDAVFRPGAVFDLPAPYGDVRCDRPVEPARARVRVREGERVREVDVPLTDGEGVLARIAERECRARAVREQVGVRLVLTGDRRGGRLGALLRVERRTATGPLALTEVRGSVLYDVRAATPVDVAEGADVAAEVGMASCSGHVLGEVKQPFAFLAFVRLGDAAPVPTEITVDPAARAALTALVDTACRDGQVQP